jgi:hypothetical protein
VNRLFEDFVGSELYISNRPVGSAIIHRYISYTPYYRDMYMVQRRRLRLPSPVV